MNSFMVMKDETVPRATTSLQQPAEFDDLIDMAMKLAMNGQQDAGEPGVVNAEEITRNNDMSETMQSTQANEGGDQFNDAVPPVMQAAYGFAPSDYQHMLNYNQQHAGVFFQGFPTMSPGLPAEIPYIKPFGHEMDPSNAKKYIPHQEYKNTYDTLSAFITYMKYNSDSAVISDVYNIVSSLRDNGISARVDYNEESVRGVNMNMWLDDNIENSTVVIVCVDPKFKTALRSSDPNSDVDENSNAECLYVMENLLTQHRNGGCQNYNVLPVLIAGANFMHLPIWLQNTNVYRWPKTAEKLIQRILSLKATD